MHKSIALALVVSAFHPAVFGYKLPDSPGSIEFVNTDGRSYLDTGVEPGAGIRVVFTFQCLRFENGSAGIQQCGYQAATNDKPVFLFGVEDTMRLRSRIGSDQGSGSGSEQQKIAGPADFRKHTFDLRSGSQKLDGEEFGTDTFGGVERGLGHTLWLFGCNNEWSHDGESEFARFYKCCTFRFYACDIYDGETLIRKYRPYWTGWEAVIRDELRVAEPGYVAETLVFVGTETSDPLRFTTTGARLSVTTEGELPEENLAEAFAAENNTPGSAPNTYIDTGIVPKSNTRLLVRFALIGSASLGETQHLGFGYQAGSNDGPQFSFNVNATTRKFQSTVATKQSPGGAATYKRVVDDIDDAIHTFDLKSGSQKFDGAEYATDTIDDSATGSIYLLALNNNWGDIPGASNACRMRIYECKIYAGDELVRDFRFTNDGLLVDLASERPWGLSGASPKLVPPSPEVVPPSPEVELSDSFTSVNNTPGGAASVYVDTQVVPKSNTRLLVRFALIGSASLGATQHLGFGYQAGSNDGPQFSFNVNATTRKFQSTVATQQSPGGASTYKRVVADIDDEIHTFDLKSGSQKFDGAEYATDTIDDSATGTLYLLALNNNWGNTPSASNACRMRIYECKIYTGDALTHDYRCTPSGQLVDLAGGAPASVLHGGLTPDVSATPEYEAVFKPVEAVWLDRSQWIGTGVVPAADTRVVFDFAYRTVQADCNQRSGVMGGVIPGAVLSFGVYNGSFASIFGLPSAQGQYAIDAFAPVDTGRHVFDIASGAQKLDDLSTVYARTCDFGAMMPNDAIRLFDLCNSDLAAGEMDCVFYGCRIYEGETLVRDYRPAVDPKTGIGLIYNKVSGKAVRMPGNPPLRLGRVVGKKGFALILK